MLVFCMKCGKRYEKPVEDTRTLCYACEQGIPPHRLESEEADDDEE